MKRILMVCEAFGGGVFNYVSQLCNDMCGHFDIYIAYRMRSLTPKNYKDIFDSRVHFIEVEHFGRKLTDLRGVSRTIKELRKIEEEVKPDIIHLHSSIAGGIGRLAFRGKNNVVVYTPHGYAHILMGDGWKSKVYELLEKLLGRTNSITLTCCESEDKVAKKLSKRTAYIETGISMPELSAALEGIKPVENEKFTVFTLGRICVQKQPQLFNEIAKLVPEAKFIWIGSGELEHFLNAPNMEVTGWKPRREALAMAEGADVFVLCSKGEAIAISLIENMYLKKLCLVSNTVGNQSVIQDGINGYVCNTAQEYADRIKASMKEFPSALAEHAYQDVLDTYNTEVMKQKFIRFYNSIGGGSSRKVAVDLLRWLDSLSMLYAGRKAVA